jgi:serine/threonine protein kinase
VDVYNPGEFIDKYKLVAKLGEGGMGTVWVAENPTINKFVALKLLRTEFSAYENVVQRFVQEARMAAAVDHPGIVEIYDFGWSARREPYLVMELLKGTTLAAILKVNQHGLPVGYTVGLVAQMLSVLGAVHDNGIIHRDLKPENIFLSRRKGVPEKVRILDFGISKMKTDEGTAGLTHTGTILGTPYYMSPEQASGEKHVDQRVDIWAAGAILYKMLVGHVPFQGDSYNEVLAKILGRTFTRPRVVRPDIPERLESVLLKAMAWERERRYMSAEQLQKDLERIALMLPLDTTEPVQPPEGEQGDWSRSGPGSHPAVGPQPGAAPARDQIPPTMALQPDDILDVAFQPTMTPGEMGHAVATPVTGGAAFAPTMTPDQATTADAAWGSQGQPGEQWAQPGQAGGQWAQQGQSGEQWAQHGQPGGQWAQQGQPGGQWAQQGQAGEQWGQPGQSGPQWGQPGQSGPQWGQPGQSGPQWNAGPGQSWPGVASGAAPQARPASRSGGGLGVIIAIFSILGILLVGGGGAVAVWFLMLGSEPSELSGSATAEESAPDLGLDGLLGQSQSDVLPPAPNDGSGQLPNMDSMGGGPVGPAVEANPAVPQLPPPLTKVDPAVPLPGTGPAGDGSASPTARGDLTDDEIAEALRPYRSKVRDCLERSSEPPSKIRVRLSVAGDGSATYRGIDQPLSSSVESCVRDALASARFPATGGSPKTISHSFGGPSRSTKVDEGPAKAKSDGRFKANPFE